MQVFHLFQGYGIELEYMIVHSETLDVLPVADEILKAVCGSYQTETLQGQLAWSNELALHVIELKTNGPAADLSLLPDAFNRDIRQINEILAYHGGCLMPGGMHPWMNPLRETRLWPHGYNAIYEAYHRIFDCRGHGWSNLQSTHLNLPFADDAEFARLHAAVRLVLPLLPSLAASTPIMDGQANGILDNRLAVYRSNQKKISAIIGEIIPEVVNSRKEYQSVILEPMYKAIAPLDTDGILQDEWLNSRGAIARFERNTIEIRLLDIDETPLADLAIIHFISEITRALVDERLSPYSEQQAQKTSSLANILINCIQDAELTVIHDMTYLRNFQFPSAKSCTAKELLLHLADLLIPAESVWRKPLVAILSAGSLSSRILIALQGDYRREKLKEVYFELCKCLSEGRLFIP